MLATQRALRCLYYFIFFDSHEAVESLRHDDLLDKAHNIDTFFVVAHKLAHQVSQIHLLGDKRRDRDHQMQVFEQGVHRVLWQRLNISSGHTE